MPNGGERHVQPGLDAACDACPLDRRSVVKGIVFAALGIAAVPRLVAAMTVMSRSAGGELKYPIPTDDGAHIDHDNGVIVVRWENVLYAFNLACPHQNTALHWIMNDKAFQCPRHHSRYQPNGTFVEGRATRGMDRFPVRRDGDSILVDVDRMIKQSDDPAAWTAACLKVA